MLAGADVHVLSAPMDPGQEVTTSSGIGTPCCQGELNSAGLPGDLVAEGNPPSSAVAGDTFNFQIWHRDAIGGAGTSNFTNAVSVSFR